MTTDTREGRERARLSPVRRVRYNLVLTPGERDELDRRAVESGCDSVAQYIRRELINGVGHPQPAA